EVDRHRGPRGEQVERQAAGQEAHGSGSPGRGAMNAPFSALGAANEAFIAAGPASPYSQQAVQCPSPVSNRGGTSSWHTGIACGQRGWNRQPEGGAMRLGGSPPPGSCRGADAVMSGAEETSSRVYGCAGRWVTVSPSPPSIIRPAYITSTSSAK